MKCPACTFVSSDLRDICPKCMIDLRPHKKLLNVTITDPDSSYEALKIKYSHAPKPPSSVPPQIKSITSFTKRLFGAPPPKPHESTPQEIIDILSWKRDQTSEALPTPQTTSPEPEQHDQEIIIAAAPIVATSNTTIVETDLNIPETPQSLGTAFVEREEIEIEEPPSIVQQVPEAEPEDISSMHTEDIFTEVTPDSSEVVSEVIESMQEAVEVIEEPIFSSDEILEQEAEPQQVATEELPPIVEQVVEEYQPPPLVEEITPSPPTTPLSYQESLVDLENEFTNAFKSLDQTTAEGFLDLSAVTTYSPVDQEHIELLFALAKDKLDPNAQIHEFTDKIALSEGKQLESAELEKRLNEVEKIINFVETPRNLSEIAKQTIISSAKRFASAKPKRERLDAPRPVVRLLAWFCDCAAILLIAITIVSLFEDKDLVTQFSELSNAKLDATERIPLVMSTLAIAPLVGLIYWCLSFIAFHSSPGGKLFGIFLVAENGRKAKFVHNFVRALTIPISTLFMGFLPILTGHRSFSDRLAHTYTVRRVSWKDIERVSK